MSEFAYIVNHTITVAWLILAGVYVYYAVIADVVAVLRRRNHPRTQTSPRPLRRHLRRQEPRPPPLMVSLSNHHPELARRLPPLPLRERPTRSGG